MKRALASAQVGLFGGTFNPIHLGHLRAAEEVAEALALERMVFVPSAQPPHKLPDRGDALAPASLRLAWVKAAIAENPRFAVDPLELERKGPSYSVDTLRAFAAKLEPARCVFVIGQDAFVELDSWREPAALLELAHFAVTTRPPCGKGSLKTWMPRVLASQVELAADGLSGRHRSAKTWIRAIEITPLDISSSDIRVRLRGGRSVRYLLPDGIHDAVVQSRVYDPGEGRSRRPGASDAPGAPRKHKESR
ncbi:MAG TPA: nicotinate-nucleotide adenylyltransferase [Myxococcota bacterium]|nr:nicotinate-nucleotide adenylyltransferase [Myxococcota bacterium]